MRLFVKSILIVDPERKEANKYIFGEHSNLIMSEGNEIGKSSLIKSIYYTLGAPIKSFPKGWDYTNFIFQIQCDIDGRALTIQRFNQVFTVEVANRVQSFANEKNFSIWMQKQMHMNLRLQTANSEKFHHAYMNAVLAPFYIDQDKSWANFYQDAFENLAMYKGQPKPIIEYYLGLSNGRLLELNEQKKELHTAKVNLDGQIKQITGVRNSYSDDKNIDVVSPEQYIELQAELNQYLKITDELQRKVSKLVNRITKSKMDLDSYRHDYDELRKLLLATDNRFKKIEYECTYCHSVLTRQQSLTRLELSDNDFEIRQQKALLNQKIMDEESKLATLVQSAESLKKDFEDKNARISELRSAGNIDRYVSIKVLTELAQLADKYQVQLSHLEAEIKRIAKSQRDEKKTLETIHESLEADYEKIKNDISVDLGTTDLSDRQFLDFKKMKGGGTALNKSLLCLYLIYLSLLSKHSKTIFPMTIDSFLKNEISTENENRMFLSVQRFFMSLHNQTFFSVIKRNKGKLNISDSTVIFLEKPMLSGDLFDRLSLELISEE
ncbi:hypothetical protein FC83_GL000298 [Agrilactobacillus composti DSM 18527 = JCM 14202]|uniref:Rad50/SbcC-type AAA domain-containing protein n=1 Tax=Agrilactobacillus composti DSM 18527 = JCM 14202 TaxID=1423734 RepID=X0PWT5_9LACO|nr:hypothetical protein [Agrilactobacillus composti]KRM36088.1 hypothetical protein FC83_GL000298 [Agrilactobacillus composti DSM 18527 = JCM 14202]GAF42041.1 hypothetical protein JCM14202_4039 [Agrilactobacillus composti DSM 18527 = JCM 14202]